MRVPLLDLAAQNGPLRTELLAAIARVVDGGQFILGPEVERFERELASALGVWHAVGVSSGTDALLVALMALGVGPGDEVVTTPYSFFASAGCIARLGARPVFVDIESDGFNLDRGATAAACGPRTRAVLPVHLFGAPLDIGEMPVPIVEDAAQAIGAAPLKGSLAGISFFPSKNLGAFGDAGAVLTNDGRLDERVRLLRGHGAKPKYIHHEVGGNFRMDALQAAILGVKLPHLAKWSAARRANAERYRALFQTAGMPAELRVPVDVPGHVYNQFVVRVPRRDELKRYLEERGVASEIYYPLPLHLQPCFAPLGYREGSFPAAEAASREALALPIHSDLTPAQQSYVVDQIARFYARPML